MVYFTYDKKRTEIRMLRFIKEAKNPELLVVTPLLSNSLCKHKISRETKVDLLRNDINFAWVSYESNDNTAKNFANGIKAYREKYTPKYVMMVDRDIIPSRHMLDRIYEVLKKSSNEIAFCYCNFEFKGEINKKFYNMQYDPILLLHGNYISSNSMIKLSKLDETGGVIVNNKYQRLLDWALWLNFLSYGYYGILCNSTSFIAISDKDSISARSGEA